MTRPPPERDLIAVFGELQRPRRRTLADLDGRLLDLYARAMSVTLSDAARKLVDEPNLAVLATLNPDGGPQTSVVWVGLDGDDVLISTAAGRRKDRNLRRDSRASLSVIDRNDGERYIEIRGRAIVTEDIDRALAVRLGEKYMGPGGGEEYRELPADVVRVVIRLTPDRVAGSAAT
jgi:PPOX class probable F420-dependent enzyme